MRYKKDSARKWREEREIKQVIQTGRKKGRSGKDQKKKDDKDRARNKETKIRHSEIEGE